MDLIKSAQGSVENSLLIHKKIIDSGAKHIVMQYPLMNIAEIVKPEFENDKTFYIENKDNFEQALKKHKWEDVFVDKFAEHFGHTTKYGHELIANEVLKRLPIILEKNNF